MTISLLSQLAVELVDGLAEGIHDGISEINGGESYCVVSRSRV
jgi:hypothetical protein